MANFGDILNNIELGATQSLRRNLTDDGFEVFVPVESSPNIAYQNQENTFTSDQYLQSNLIVDGNIIANQYIISSSVTYMTQSFSSGSTLFGDSIDDTHIFTGSIYNTGSIITDGLYFGDGDTGFYESSDDSLKLNVGSSTTWRFSTTTIGGDGTFYAQLRHMTPSSTIPGFQFDSDTDTGIGRAGANTGSLIAGGVNVLNWYPGSVDVTGKILLSGSYDTNTALLFGDGDTGIYESGDDVLKLKTNGTDRITVDEGNFLIIFNTPTLRGSGTNRFGISGNAVASDTNPVFMPNNSDQETGIGWGGTGTGSLISNGINVLNWYSGNSDINGNLTVGGNITAKQFIVSSSVTYLTQSFSSGSTRFGDSSDDTHIFTGSQYISGSIYFGGEGARTSPRGDALYVKRTGVGLYGGFTYTGGELLVGTTGADNTHIQANSVTELQVNTGEVIVTNNLEVGGTFVLENTQTNPFYLRRLTGNDQSVKLYVDDSDFVLQMTQDEAVPDDHGGFKFIMDSGAKPTFKIFTSGSKVFSVSDSGSVFVSGSSLFGNNISDTHFFTGSVRVDGNLYVGANEILSTPINSISSSYSDYAITASYALSVSSSFAGTHTYFPIFTLNGDNLEDSIMSQSGSNVVVSGSLVTYATSGVNIFGNSMLDQHAFTGSVNITGSLLVNGFPPGMSASVVFPESTFITSSYATTMSFDNEANFIYSCSLEGDSHFQLINHKLGETTLVTVFYTGEDQVVTYDSTVRLTGGTQNSGSGEWDHFAFTCVNKTEPRYILSIISEPI